MKNTVFSLANEITVFPLFFININENEIHWINEIYNNKLMKFAYQS